MATTGKHFRKRDAILSYLRHTDQHPSAETVYAAMKPQIPDLSLGTVYRNLAYFRAEGLVNSLGSVGGVERYDGHIEPHVHFVCTVCGCIRDLHHVRVPQELTAAAGAEAGAQVDTCCLTFQGKCSNCQGCPGIPADTL